MWSSSAGMSQMFVQCAGEEGRELVFESHLHQGSQLALALFPQAGWQHQTWSQLQLPVHGMDGHESGKVSDLSPALS